MSLKPGHMAHLDALMPHMSLKPGHIARFNALHAPHVPQHRTHGAPQRPICPTCPSDPDTWRTSTPYMPHMSLSTGHMVRFNVLYAPHFHQTRTHGAIHYGTGTYQNFSSIFTTSVYPKPRILAIWGISALNRYFTSEISLSISSPVNEDSASFWNSVLHMSGREAKIV